MVCQAALQLHGVVAGVEDEQRDGLSFGQPTKQLLELLHGHLVGVLRGLDAPHVDRRHPGITGEAEFGDELVSPPGDDGLAGGVAARVVIEAALGARLGIAARPYRDVHRVDRRGAPTVVSQGATGEQIPQVLLVDASLAQRRVEAAPPPPVNRRQTQVRRRGDGARGQEGIGQLEERVGSSIEALVERVAEGT